MLPKINGVFRLVNDPELRYSNSNTTIAKMTLVSSEKYKEKEDTCFIDATVFGALGEKVVMKYLKKGSQVYVDGKLKQDQWTAQDGSKKSKHSITVDNLKMIDSRNTSESNGQPKQQYANESQNETQHRQDQSSFPEIDIDDDSIPF